MFTSLNRFLPFVAVLTCCTVYTVIGCGKSTVENPASRYRQVKERLSEQAGERKYKSTTFTFLDLYSCWTGKHSHSLACPCGLTRYNAVGKFCCISLKKANGILKNKWTQ